VRKRDVSKKKSPPYVMHVISHTHWDREWRYSFQQFRIMLVDMMDHLIETLTEYPDYRKFHLDSQTIVLEDYLAVRPEKRQELEAFIRTGRLIVGPWYILPDPAPLDGESLIRNLLTGMTITRAFGGQEISGYSPFGFGQVSQTPQIYRGFGLDNILFYRGNNKHQTKQEFIWEGPDGSRLLGFRLPEIFARGNFWVNVYRPALFNKWPFDWDYSWDERQLPYHPCDEDSYGRYDYYLLENRDGETYYPENLPRGLATAKEQVSRDSTTRHLLYMEGHDQSEAHPRIVQIVADADRLSEDTYLHDSIANYVEAVKKEAKNLKVMRGEFRYPNVDGLWLNLYYGTLAARLYLKQANRAAENSLRGICEPLCSAAWLLGEDYPSGLLTIAWKHLLMNQAHDSIAGCSIDKVHEDCEYRFRQVREIADTLAMAKLGAVVKNLDAADLPEDANLLVAFNPGRHERDEVCLAAVDVPLAWEPAGIRIYDTDGGERPLQCVSDQTFSAIVKLPRELPLSHPVKRFLVRFATGPVPGLGYKTFVVRHEKTRRRNRGSLCTGPSSLENEYLAVRIHSNGTFDLTDKERRRTYTGLHSFEDSSDVGDPWTRKTVQREEVITSLGSAAQISCVEDGPLSAAFRIELTLSVPKRALPDNTRRADERVPLHLAAVLRLNRGSRRIEMETSYENPARDHRLRVLFPTDLSAESSWAESQFDVVSRPVRPPDDAAWKEPAPRAHPALRFCDLTDGKAGFALLNLGLPEYEAVHDARRTMALTLLRTCRFPMIGTDPDNAPEHPLQNGGQCLRRHTQRYAIYPHRGDWQAGDVYGQAEAFNLPLRLAQCGRPTGTLPLTAAFFAVQPESVQLSCVKKAEDRDSLILRLYNPTDGDLETTVRSLVPLAGAYRNELDERRIIPLELRDGTGIAVTIPRKKVETLELVSREPAAAR